MMVENSSVNSFFDFPFQFLDFIMKKAMVFICVICAFYCQAFSRFYLTKKCGGGDNYIGLI